jgi:putative colanic acid biosynthesis acetyltransferase WcaB
VSLSRSIFQDWAANKGNLKGRYVLTFFRCAQIFAHRKGSLLWWLGLPVMIAYRFIMEYIMSIELRPRTRVGPGLLLEHGFALVVNDRTVIGRNVHLRHSITIGCVKLPDGSQGPSPVIEDDVEVGANACIIGGIRIGRGSKIGAGAVVVKDVPPYVVVGGNPAVIIKRLEPAAGGSEATSVDEDTLDYPA